MDLSALAEVDEVQHGAGWLGPSGWIPASDRFVMLAACRDHEKASEVVLSGGSADAISHGAFTYYLGQQVRNCPAEASTRAVFKRAAICVTTAFAEQHPSCEGARDRVLFGVGETAPLRYVLVSGVDGDLVTLDAGLSQGVAADSLWEVYPPGTTDFAGHTESVSRLRVIECATGRSTALLQSGSPPVMQYSRAIEVERPIDCRWPIEVVTDLGTQDMYAEQFREALSSSLWLRHAAPGETAQARAYLLAPRTMQDENVQVPQLPALATETWATIGRDGQLCTCPLESYRVQLLHDDLAALARQHFIRLLQNPELPLNEHIRWRLLPKTQHPDAETAALLAQSAQPYRFPLGTALDIELHNSSQQVLYLHFLFLDADAGVSLVFPPPGGTFEVRPGWFGRLGERFELTLTPQQSWLAEWTARDATAPALVAVKLLASSVPIDITPLLQATRRSDFPPLFQGCDSALGQILQATMSQRVDDAGVRSTSPRSEDWFTDLRDVLIG